MAQVNGQCSLVECPLQRTQATPGIPEEIKKRLADAYAEQSQSDFRVYSEHLRGAEECHRLHYLQMACEKIAKAYRVRDLVALGSHDLYSHLAFSRFIVGFLKNPQIRLRYAGRDAKRRQIERDAHVFSAEIEKLAPAVDREQTPANVEYPWAAGATVFVPCRHDYPLSRRLREQSGRDFLKLVETAIGDYETITLTA